MKENSILVSVIIPCYNQGHYIEDALSIFNNYVIDNIEIIIVNDGSSDENTIAELWKLKSIGYNVIFQDNQGLGKARNNGIRLSKGKYILPLDSDNKIKMEYISKAIDIMERDPGISIVYSDRELFGEDVGRVEVGPFSISTMFANNYIDACAIFRRSVWDEVGGYDENFPVQGWEDWDFWLSAAEKGFKFFYIAEPLFFYRVTENSMIRYLMKHPNREKYELIIYKKHLSYFVETYRHQLSGYLYSEQHRNKHPLRTAIKYFAMWIRSL